jgi:hypothetical protein
MPADHRRELLAARSAEHSQLVRFHGASPRFTAGGSRNGPLHTSGPVNATEGSAGQPQCGPLPEGCVEWRCCVRAAEPPAGEGIEQALMAIRCMGRMILSRRVFLSIRVPFVRDRSRKVHQPVPSDLVRDRVGLVAP